MPIEEVGMAEIGSFFLVGFGVSGFGFWVLFFFFFFAPPVVTNAYRRGGYG